MARCQRRPSKKRQTASLLPAVPLLTLDDRAVYRPAQVLAALGLSATTLRREVRLGRLKVQLVAGRHVVTGAALWAWITAKAYVAPGDRDGTHAGE